MPIYEYRCKACDQITNVYREHMDPPRFTRCETCGRRAYKIISCGGFLLKGPGWPGKELSMGEVVANEKKRDKEFKRRQKELRKEGAPLPYWGD